MLPRDFDTATAFPPGALPDWRALVDKDLSGASFEKKLITRTYEGIDIRPLYTDADWPHASGRSGMSGLMPMTRGCEVLGKAIGGWEICQERREADVDALNRAVLEDLAGGVGGVLLRLDACARAGMDPDEGGPMAGADGAMVYSVDDLDRALKGVHLDMISVSLESGQAFVEGAGLLAALWERRGVKREKARGAFNADPLAVLARDGRLDSTIGDALNAAAELALWTNARYPGVTSVRVGTAPYHHGGATATQDLAFSLATGLEYLRAMTGAGMSVDEAARQLRFSFALGCNVFLATAKLRAARRVWARVIEACGGSEEAGRMRIHARTSKRVLASRDPWVNILRNTACVLAGGLGGADSIGSEAFDAVLGEASELGRRLARNTHHILMEECGVHRICDAAGGAWYIETLTDELCEKAWIIFQAIESRGGMARVLSNGWVGEQIDSAFKPRARNLATRRDAVLGASEFPLHHETAREPKKVDLASLRAEACKRARAARERLPTPGLNDRCSRGAQGAFELALRGATIGQIHRSVRRAGSTPTVLLSAITVHPYAEPFERLRDASERIKELSGRDPVVFLASMGTASEHLARTNFCRNLFESGGFEVVGGGGYMDASEACGELAASGAHVAVICSGDEQYPAIVPTLAPALHAVGATSVLLAGNPGSREQEYRCAGVDRFVFVKCDVVELLGELLRREGATL